MTSAALPAVRPPATTHTDADVCSNDKNPRLTRMSSEDRLMALQLAILDYYTSHRLLLMSDAMIEALTLAGDSLHVNQGYAQAFRRLRTVVRQEQLHERDEAIGEAVAR